eukprot:TRINITY_DN25654_c0_g1_i3.p1 TRINITY_DN25654_c0_g1~~TRINITY_DN25654_c0_g1_i3.p1  ORF type:complete len:561 (+),score=128.06 TRINITY_DN25654_c0_g1_i3:207-1685(+)
MAEVTKLMDKDQAQARRSPDGKYLRKGFIGKGSFKHVYEAFDTDSAIQVAWNEAAIDTTEREIDILCKLSHPNIVNIYSAWEDTERRLMVFITELLTSGSLRQYMRGSQSTSMGFNVVRNWGSQILQGLKYLHDNNVWHRDLKCDNIFVNGHKGEVKIGDFGLSCSIASSAARSVIGTPEFMAPEIYDEKYTEKVDIYSFGMCLLEMCSGTYPYAECENCGQVFKKVTKGIPPKALTEMEDSAVKRIIQLCLVTAEKRPSAVDLLENDLFKSPAVVPVDRGAIRNVLTRENTAEVGPVRVGVQASEQKPQEPVAGAVGEKADGASGSNPSTEGDSSHSGDKKQEERVDRKKEHDTMMSEQRQQSAHVASVLLKFAPKPQAVHHDVNSSRAPGARVDSNSSSSKAGETLAENPQKPAEKEVKPDTPTQPAQIRQQPAREGGTRAKAAATAPPTGKKAVPAGTSETDVSYTDQLTSLRANQSLLLQKLHSASKD